MRIKLLLFFLLNTCSISGQFNTAITTFDTGNGLPSNEVYDIEQDANGFIWVATDHGVARYDGYKFEVFTTNEGLTDNV